MEKLNNFLFPFQLSLMSHIVAQFCNDIQKDGKIVGHMMEHVIRACLKKLLEPEGIVVRDETETRHYFEEMRDSCVEGRMEASLWKSDIFFLFRIFQVYIQVKWNESPEVKEFEEFVKHIDACSILLTACKPMEAALRPKKMGIWICKTAGPRIIALATAANIKIITLPVPKTDPFIFAIHVIGELADLLLISRADDRCRACEHILKEFNGRINGSLI